MALYCLDSSALVKWYVHERGRAWLRGITANASGHLIHISLFSVAESASALARRHREGSVSASKRDRLFGAFLVDCARSYLLLRVEEDVIQCAVGLVNQYPLRTAAILRVYRCIIEGHWPLAC